MNHKPLTINHELILGVKVDFISSPKALELVSSWLNQKKKKYIVTPNVEIIMAAQSDQNFKTILNDADLSIADSFRLDWASKVLNSNLLGKIFLWPFFIFPNLLSNPKPVLTGTDLMFELCKLASEKSYRVGFIGGKEGVAQKAAENLKGKFPKLKVTFSESGGKVNKYGDTEASDLGFKIKDLRQENHKSSIMNHKSLPEADLLFVGFGHGKQEKWIIKNKNKVSAKIFIAVGGALDYFSGQVPRAPKVFRLLGFEWLFRLIVQPWRIKRFASLVKFVFLILASTKS